ncbi:MAG: hypothetical protein Q7S87_03475 [Agitococcus sp.]|nr:hypothetical protein [Agitococcus sp.]MDO9178697.1 hypothetical protein [Agitococcus sp.]
MSKSLSSAPKLVVFADLDDTLFQTLHKRNAGGAIPMGYGRDDAPLSYACPKQQKLLACFMDQGTVIPTTARNYESFKRVRYPFSSYAILNFGATLLNPDGALNEEWHATMCAKAQLLQEELLAHLERAQLYDSRYQLGLTIRLVSDFGQAWYVLVKHLGHLEGPLDALQERWLQTISKDFVVRRNGNNLTLSPTFLDKKHAVERVVGQYFDIDRDLFIGAGDSLSDFDFMSTCDYLLTPAKSQLHNSFGKNLK